MKNKISKIISFTLIIMLSFCLQSFAATLDPTIPLFNANQLTLTSDGNASFVPPQYGNNWKKFEVQLLKRVTTVTATGSVVYTYKTQGSVKNVDITDTSYDFTISSVGYYQFQIRGVNLDNNYGAWVAIYDSDFWKYAKDKYPGVTVTEDDISAGGGSSTGTGTGSWNDYYYGPGVINYGYNPYYTNQYGIIGPNGQYIYNGQNYQYNPNYQNGTQYIYPNTGIQAYPQVPAPYGNNTNQYNQYGTQNGYNVQNGYNNQNSQTNPNYYNGSTQNNYSGSNVNNYVPGNNTTYGSPQISQGLEIGWHIDNVGRFYYQGNGVVLKGTWYFIDGSYYRFSDNGYVLVNQWFNDTTTGYWYYLGGDGRMLIGWQCINGTWYYFKPENGNGYGTMYRNATLQITDASWGTGFYAFDSNGATVMNAWYGGYYYGRDGKRTN